MRGNGVTTNSGVQFAGNSNDLLNNLNTTWFVVRRCRDTTVRSSYMMYGYDAGGSNRAFLGAPDGSNITWDYGNATAGSGRLQAAYTKDTQLETLVVVAGQTKGREIWRRGVKIASNASAKAARPSDANPFGIGPIGNTTPFDDVETYVFGVVNREWTDAEIIRWCADPWQILDDPSLVSARAAASGTTDTPVNPAAGALALTGFAPVVTQSITTNVSPGAGALSLSGYAPTVTQSSTTSVAPQVGALTLAGYAPAVARTTNGSVSPSVGSLSLAGYAPTVARTANQSVQLGVVGLTLTGYAPLIFQGPDNAPRVYMATIMRITTTNRVTALGAVLNAAAPIRSTGPNAATILDAGAVNRAADVGPATLNRTVSFP
jgi:hypothetical protein